ncbi:MAG: DUF4065 domain-containing protein [Deltaproteobacteria bacterium]|nr:DUF4065 domain-containing protein [Deltaproteobacteria bacterium]
MEQGYDARAIANLFLTWAREDKKSKSYTPMKIIKLVYIAHGWCLAISQKPLIINPVEAWRYGPVIRSLYDEFKKFGNGTIQGLAEYSEVESKSGEVKEHIEEEFVKTLRSVYQLYGDFEAFQLANLTHMPNSPWAKAIEDSKAFISNDIMKAEYERLWKRNQEQAQAS